MTSADLGLESAPLAGVRASGDGIAGRFEAAGHTWSADLRPAGLAARRHRSLPGPRLPARARASGRLDLLLSSLTRAVAPHHTYTNRTPARRISDAGCHTETLAPQA